MESFRIGEIEEILINAFPAVEREIYDGWILNFSGGYTYRANCINPFILPVMGWKKNPSL